jgi:hypothetical protein
VLDAVGLIFFISPGVIAFAVDFTQGTIYLPHRRRGALDLKNLEKVAMDKNHMAASDLEAVVAQHTGISVKFSRQDLIAMRMGSDLEMRAQFALAEASGLKASRLLASR